jgi:hypothetical protein
MILKVNILKTVVGDADQEIILILGWDDEQEKIVIVEENVEDIAKNILAQEYRGKDLKLISMKDGKRFIQELHYGINGAYLRASKPYK